MKKIIYLLLLILLITTSCASRNICGAYSKKSDINTNQGLIEMDHEKI